MISEFDIKRKRRTATVRPQIGQHVRSDARAKRAAKITGIGEIGASALVAGVGTCSQFDSGAQCGTWLG